MNFHCGIREYRNKGVLAALILALSVTGFGLRAEAAVRPADMPEETWARLNDCTIEWDEIGNLVKYWNPTYTTYANQASETITDMKSATSTDISTLKESIREVDDAIENIRTMQAALIAQGGEGTIAYQQLSASLAMSSAMRKTLKANLSQMGDTSRQLGYSAKRAESALTPLRDQMTSVVEGLVISYKTLEVNRTMVAEQVALYQALLETRQQLFAQNMATSVEVQKAQADLDSAVGTLSSLDSGMRQLKKNLLIQCGYDPNTEVVIADLPAPDRNYLAGRDYTTDRQTAVNANAGVKEAQKTKNYQGNVFFYADANTNAAEAKAAAKMDSLHAELEKQLLLCDATDTGFQKAALMLSGAEQKYQLGLLGRGEYEGLKMQYIAAKAAAELNILNLHQAIENYRYAVRGIMSVN